MKPGATFLLDWRLRGLLERGQLLILSKRELQGIEDKDGRLRQKEFKLDPLRSS